MTDSIPMFSDLAGGGQAANPLAAKAQSAGDSRKGHRRRLRQRFLAGGADAMPDYELLEMLLFMAMPRGDVKPLAKALIGRFGTYAGVVTAPAHEIEQVPGAGEAVVAALRVAQATAVRLLKDAAREADVLNNYAALIDYCQAAMKFDRVEQTRLLFLNKKNRLIADELQQHGTVDHTPVYPREVARRTLELGASAVILVHNHPSGDPTPSRGDIEITRLVKAALEAIGVKLHDHLIVGGDEYTSFRNHGLL